MEGSDERAILAYEKAAEANYRGGGTLWHAAKHLEEAGALSAKLLKWDAAIDFYERASNDFVKGGVASNGTHPQKGYFSQTQTDPDIYPEIQTFG